MATGGSLQLGSRHRELPGLLVVVADLRIATATGAALEEAAVALVAAVVVVPQNLRDGPPRYGQFRVNI